ncbi:MAG: outer membrane protein assembly factor BamD [Campylobacterales bacterium]|nr:outer membrane protein assembly factor BamD [Campylobacterales bacterium]
MLKSIKYSMIGTAVLLLFVGCAKDDDTVKEFNKPALYWYQHIGSSISDKNLDKADAYYISLKSEHMHSPLMPTANLMLAYAHMDNEEYLLADYYLDEYNKRFGDAGNKEYIDFIKLKASFLGIKDVYKDQKLIMDSIEKAKKYQYRYPGSTYLPLVNNMLIRLHMSQYLLNENIAALYERTGKENAAKIYREKNNDSIIQMTDITPPQKGIVGEIFD